MQEIKFPVKFLFKITTFSNDFTATDADGKVVAYVKQKMFKLKEAITVFSDDSKSEELYSIDADRIIDFSASYTFTDKNGAKLGKISRKGLRSIWKAEYDIMDRNDQLQFKIREENPWIKVADSFFGELPLIGILSGYVFNPVYLVTDRNENVVAKLKKQPSFFGREFEVTKEGEFKNAGDDDRIMLGLMMMILLERRRG